ncbi:hypothetical protein DRW03_24295 [Corallococcus sp. H22C18031201]|uniref:hypothetical protein n=1 Tax=Citreicoccus inhibens TaxID=2849499 RepID=UPI000E71B480|nr:hypothetical protein [Citreicoccus inhibens]MBU8896499.1 hypothetical protein [Citreicoccus inhibens]RJS18783.1 hypothetical protein DRW03_24295 [Corallococcus sp. H22C18031201]
MNLLVLPPHRDVTLRAEAPEGWRVLDVARDYCRRVFASDSVAAEAEARAHGALTPQSLRELLLLKAAQALRARDSDAGHGTLRALGAVLTALSGAPSEVQLRLDDVALHDGSTERSEDVLRALDAPLPYQEDLARAIQEFTGATRVRLWLEKDLQLPAAAWLARECPPDVALELAGPFVHLHRAALARLSPFQRATFPEGGEVPRWRVAAGLDAPDGAMPVWIPDLMELVVVPPPEERKGTDLVWTEASVTAGAPRWRLGARTASEVRAFTGGAPWAGHVALGTLFRAEALVESGCQLAVVGFCAIRDGLVIDPQGNALSVDFLRRGMEHLRRAGVSVVAEWWVGAPAVDEGALEQTLATLLAEPLFDWIAGVRPFHWALERGPEARRFDERWVQPGTPPADRDLARSRPFDVPDTLRAARLPEVLSALALRLLRRQPLSPGRVAGAYLRVPALSSPPGSEARGAKVSTQVRLDTDCAVVDLPASLDGVAKPSWYAANLRTGSVLALDTRLAPKLSTLLHATEVSEALSEVPEAHRAKLVDALVGKAVLERVHA